MPPRLVDPKVGVSSPLLRSWFSEKLIQGE